MNSRENIQSSRVFRMFEQPSGWLDASLPQIINQQALEHLPSHKNFKATVIVPIHNESRSLESVLGSILMADKPKDSSIQFLLILNGCNDNNMSYNITKMLLNELGTLETCNISLPESLEVEDTALKVTLNECEFYLIASMKPSKTNALNIGNLLASQYGSQVTVNIDANNWIEPQSLSSILVTARDTFKDKKVAVVGGVSHIDYRESKTSHLFKKARQKKSASALPNALHGWLMAWDTEWLESIGGFPPVANDDYTLSLLARKSQKDLIFDSNAHIWGYFANTPIQVTKAFERATRDKIQLAHFYENDKEITSWIYDDEPYMRPLPLRFKSLKEKIAKKPELFLLWIAVFMLWEYSRFKGKKLYRDDPESQTWEQIDSTK